MRPPLRWHESATLAAFLSMDVWRSHGAGHIGLTNRIVGGGVGEQLVRRFAEAAGLTPNGRHS